MLFRSRLTLLVALGCIALAGSGCGRRGALQAPPDPSTVTRGPAVADPTAVADGDDLDPTAIFGSSQPLVDPPAQTSKGAKRGYVIPKQPFILDPLL